MRPLKTWIAWGAAGLLMAAAHSFPAQAQEHPHGGGAPQGGFSRGYGGHEEGREEHGAPRGEREVPGERIEPHHEHGEVREFRAPDRDAWRHGHWVQEEHEGHPGWWWVVGGVWYPFAAPVYPSAPYPLDTYPPSAPATYQYYCASSGLYYPDVTDCPEGWSVQLVQPAP